MKQNIVLVTLAVLFVTSVQACDIYGVQTCVSEMQTSAQQFDNFAGISKDVLNKVCGLLADATDCMRAAEAGCSEKELGPIQGVVDNIQFICREENKRILLENSACLEGAQQDIAACVRPMQNLGTSGQSKDGMCNTVKDTVSCVYDVIEDYCNKEAAVLYRDWMLKMMGPSLVVLDCTVSAGITNAPGGFLLFFAALLVHFSK